MPSALRPLQLRSSSAHCVRKLAKSLAKSWQGGSEHVSGCKGGGGEAGGEGGRRRRSWRRRRRRRRTTVINLTTLTWQAGNNLYIIIN